MARNVKKVKIQRKRSKKFWAILWSSIVGGVILLATAITLICVFVLNKDEETYQHFDSIKSNASISYDSLLDTVNEDRYEHLFIYYWDTSLDPENNKTDKEKEEKVISLYNAVEAYNLLNKEETVAFFLLETTTTPGSSALTDETLGNIETSNQLVYMYGGQLKDYEYGNTKGDDMSGNSVSELTSAIAFVRNLSK